MNKTAYLKPGETTWKPAAFLPEYKITNPELIIGRGVYPVVVKDDTATITWEPYPIGVEAVAAVQLALTTREGLGLWQNEDLSGDAGATQLQKWKNAEGELNGKPGWQYTGPIRHLTSPEEFTVEIVEEVRRFPVTVRVKGIHSMFGSFPTGMECTEASSKKIRSAVAAAGDDAYNQFDRTTQEAVIYKPTAKFTLTRWLYLQTVELYVMPAKSPIGEDPHGPYPGYPRALEEANAFLVKTPKMTHVFIVERGTPWLDIHQVNRKPPNPSE